MKLTERDLAKLLDAMRAKAEKPQVCSVCGHNEWALNDHTFELRSFAKGSLATGPVFPVVVLMCGNCGNSHFLNAIVLGLVEQPAAVPEKAEAAK